MHMAAKYGRLAELNLVIEFAPKRINKINSYGSTPLHCAAQHNQESAVSLLLSAKADANAANSYYGTPLIYARGDQVRQLLREAGGH